MLDRLDVIDPVREQGAKCGSGLDPHIPSLQVRGEFPGNIAKIIISGQVRRNGQVGEGQIAPGKIGPFPRKGVEEGHTVFQGMSPLPQSGAVRCLLSPDPLRDPFRGQL